MLNFDVRVSSKSSDDKLYLNPPLHFYIIFFIITAIIVGSVLVTSLSVASLILLVISIGALTYREKWLFDRELKQVIVVTGLLLIYKRSVYSFDQIEDVEKKQFIKGQTSTEEKISKLFKKLFSLKIYFNDGKDKVITIVNESDQFKLDNIYDEIKRIIK